MSRVIVYTDGACSGNPGPGGWAWVVPDGPYAAGFDADTTNQRMELVAALEAVRALEHPVEVVSDSTYLVNCFRDGWWKGWLARDWVTSAKKPVANRDLWEPLVELVGEGDVTFRWVKGHSGDRWNDVADRLAVEARDRRQGRSGSGGAEPIEADGADEEAANRRLVVLGHRPPELGGYDANPTADAVARRLREILGAKHELHPDLVVVSGLRLGAELLGAEAAVALGIPLEVVLPYPDPETVWPAPAQRRFRDLIDAATEVVTLQRRAPDDRRQAKQALDRRDAWLARSSHEAVIVWDGDDTGVGATVKKFEKALGDDVWVLDPKEC